jgi:dihydropteroate synthase
VVSVAGYRLMGIVNVTPDSFSDGGLFLDAGAALAHGLELVEQGAHILDVGGESTRPGAEAVGVGEELRRVVPVVERLVDAVKDTSAQPQVSIDTSKATVARAALQAGATLVNDVSALRADPEMAGVVADSAAECCLMHMLGEPRTMQRGVGGPQYKDVVDDVKAFLEERLAFAVGAGIHERRILLDPGIGFGKTVAHNLALLRRLDELVALGRPIVIGSSRKSFLGRIAADALGAREPVAPDERLPGTIATNVLALERGACVFRVHDVAPVAAALAAAAATLSDKWTATPTTS